MSTRQQRALLQLVREVSRRQIAPRAPWRGPPASFPADLFALLAELDLLGLPFSPDVGGSGQPTTIVCQVLTELSQAFVAVGLGTSVHLLATGVVADHGTAELRDDMLPRLIAGEWLAGHALTSAMDPGAMPAGVVLRRTRESYVLDGSLPGVVHAGHADCYVLVGRSPDGTGGMTALLVSADSAGLTCVPDDGHAAMHAVSVGTLRCEGVEVPVECRLGIEGQGEEIVGDAYAVAQLSLAACAVGLAQAALHAASGCLRAARASGAGLDDDLPDIVADMAAAVDAAQALCARAASARDAREPIVGVASMARIVADDAATEACTRALHIDSRTGCGATPTVQRYRHEATALQWAEGGHHIARRAIAREVLGDPGDIDER